ncbi:hypothetical protein ERUR111494_08105 [Erysipelothrix urinaevulpis]|uniref:hypothetical protein n=1 Tax=Erysipelothrix urinaevulpis TaxID=2683717 RepID=UPI00135966FF|nr:hypothetical protein [Erysipelothrix urinaevulpis]
MENLLIREYNTLSISGLAVSPEDFIEKNLPYLDELRNEINLDDETRIVDARNNLFEIRMKSNISTLISRLQYNVNDKEKYTDIRNNLKPFAYNHSAIVPPNKIHEILGEALELHEI